MCRGWCECAEHKGVSGMGATSWSLPPLPGTLCSYTLVLGCLVCHHLPVSQTRFSPLSCLPQIWAGVKQKELGLGSMQLLHQYVPLAAGLLGVLVPLFEPMGWVTQGPGTILGYRFTLGSVAAIAISAMLGLLVNLSTFLVRVVGVRVCTRGHMRPIGWGMGAWGETRALPPGIRRTGCNVPGTAFTLTPPSPSFFTHPPPTHSLAPPTPPAGDWRHEQPDVQRGWPHQDGVDIVGRGGLLWRHHAAEEAGGHRGGHGGHRLVGVLGGGG